MRRMVSPTGAPTRADIFVSVVGVIGPSTLDAAQFVQDAHRVLTERYANYELIVIDNDAAADELIAVRSLLDELDCIRVLRLSRRFTLDTAIFAGLEAAIGDYVVVLTPGMDPAEIVADVVDLNKNGADIVQGISRTPLGRNRLDRLGRNLFYAYNRRSLGIAIPNQATNLTGLSRRAVNSLTNSARSHRYLRHLIRHVGFTVTDLDYDPRLHISPSRSLAGGTREAIEMVSSYSTHPLRLITIVGVIAAILNFGYAVYVLVVNLVRANVAEGWSSTSLQLSSMFFIICIILAVQAEYIGRILAETRREPPYFIIESLESETLLAELDRRNVTD